MLDLIFFALLAGFVITRLFRILGQNDDNNDRSSGMDNLIKELRQKDNVDIDIVSELEASLPQDYRNIFDNIRKYDPGLNAEHFIDGAKKAFEMILKAFQAQDLPMLQKLTDDAAYKIFQDEISHRQESGFIYENTVVGIQGTQIINMQQEGKLVHIKIKFDSEQVNLIKDQEGQLLEGNPSRINTVEDVWTFTKNIRSNDKIWKLTNISNS